MKSDSNVFRDTVNTASKESDFERSAEDLGFSVFLPDCLSHTRIVFAKVIEQIKLIPRGY